MACPARRERRPSAGGGQRLDRPAPALPVVARDGGAVAGPCPVVSTAGTDEALELEVGAAAPRGAPGRRARSRGRALSNRHPAYFTVLPRRWKVERILTWITGHRRYVRAPTDSLGRSDEHLSSGLRPDVYRVKGRHRTCRSSPFYELVEEHPMSSPVPPDECDTLRRRRKHALVEKFTGRRRCRRSIDAVVGVRDGAFGCSGSGLYQFPVVLRVGGAFHAGGRPQPDRP